MSVKPRCYISLMDVAQNLIWISSYYIYLKLLMIILFSFQWCLLKAAFFWKTMFVVIYTKIFIVRKGVSAPLFFFHAPFSISCSRFFRNMQPPLSLLTPITGKYQILWWYTGIGKTENNMKLWKHNVYRNCMS